MTFEEPAPKRQKFEGYEGSEDYSKYLNPDIFKEDFKHGLTERISKSKPYKWGHISNLVNEELLKDVRDEILNNVHFTKKETDIYKVFQSGDLQNLSGLPKKDLDRLPNLLKLRNAIYSDNFKDFISEVTQSGKISSRKFDMSVNIYNKGCHLLTHDDVIGTRRVSFILYLPDPSKVWKDHYGGALRLFDSHYSNLPKTEYHGKFVPQFNDYAFFEVLPGYSFHEVEEVKVDRQRISIQGWFHIPQAGEDGFEEEQLKEKEKGISTLQLLESDKLVKFDYPRLDRELIKEPKLWRSTYDMDFNKCEMAELSKFINKKHFDNLDNIKENQEFFIKNSMISIKDFLNEDFSSALKKCIRFEELEYEVPTMSKDIAFPWKVAMSAVKRRFLYIDGKKLEDDIMNELLYEKETESEKAVRVSKRKEIEKEMSNDIIQFDNIAKLMNLKDSKDLENHNVELVEKLCQLANFLHNHTFQKYLIYLTGLIPISQQVLIRRFRPGSDFTLATNQDSKSSENINDATIQKIINDDKKENKKTPSFESIDGVLEATLNLTPTKGWESGELGGYELCMQVDEDAANDPAIYRKKSKTEGEGDDGVVLNNPADWNSLNVILRDESILKFVKYVSYGAKGSRWDISCQWDVIGEEEVEEEE